MDVDSPADAAMRKVSKRQEAPRVGNPREEEPVGEPQEEHPMDDLHTGRCLCGCQEEDHKVEAVALLSVLRIGDYPQILHLPHGTLETLARHMRRTVKLKKISTGQ